MFGLALCCFALNCSSGSLTRPRSIYQPESSRITVATPLATSSPLPPDADTDHLATDSAQDVLL